MTNCYCQGVPLTLLARYVNICSQLSMCVSSGAAAFVTALDNQRKLIHDDILTAAGTTRDDAEFALWLAKTVEEMIEATKRD